MPKGQPLIWHSLSVFKTIVRALPHEKAVALGGALGALVAKLTAKPAHAAKKFSAFLRSARRK